uniref:Cyclic AMP-dependent transcription factor ATF-4 n=1 Tax=Hucho hucho TaxID=62062 RepID=A0A4W5LW65_9TELE
MTMMSSQFGLDDMEALLWGPSSLMADPMGSLLHHDEVASIEGVGVTPLVIFSTSPSIPSSLSADLLSFPWLSADELGHTHHIGADDGKDAFSGMDWMAKKVDLSEFDLDSHICSCSPDGSPCSPEDHIEELEIKSEPQYPAPSLPPSPTFTLELGSEVNASGSVSERLLPLKVPQPVPSIVLSLSPTRIVLLAPKHEVGVTTITIPEILSSDSDSNLSSSGQLNWLSIATTQSRFKNRRKPYPTTPKSRPQHPDQPSPTTTSTGGPPKEKKLKKMTKKTEQEALSAECDKLEQRNHKLAEKADSIANGIQYLKDLMEEVCQSYENRSHGGTLSICSGST